MASVEPRSPDTVVAFRLAENYAVALFFAALAIANIVIAGDWAEDDGWASAGPISTVALAAFTAWMAARQAFAAVSVDATTLTVRNNWRTWRYHLSMVARFELAPSRFSAQPRAVVRFLDGTAKTLDALPLAPVGLFGQRVRVERALAELNRAAGLGGDPPPNGDLPDT